MLTRASHNRPPQFWASLGGKLGSRLLASLLVLVFVVLSPLSAEESTSWSGAAWTDGTGAEGMPIAAAEAFESEDQREEVGDAFDELEDEIETMPRLQAYRTESVFEPRVRFRPSTERDVPVLRDRARGNFARAPPSLG